MRYKDEQALNAALAAGEKHRVYLLYGAENFLIEQWAKKLTGSDKASPFNFQRMDGRKPDIDAVWDAVEALPLMAQEKVVLLDDLDVTKLGGDMDKMEQMLDDLPESSLLVITAKAPGFSAGSPQAKKLIKLAEKAGAVAQLDARDAKGLTRYLTGIAKRCGCELSADQCKYLLRICDNDMHALRTELEKVCAFAGGGAIERAHIDAVVVPKTEARIFDLQKHILAGNPAPALEVLDALFYLREQPVGIAATMAMSLTDLYRARVAKERGWTQPQFAERFGYKGRGEYRAKRAFSDSGRLSVETLRAMLDNLLRCDIALKSSAVDDRVLLEQTVLRQIALAQERR